MEILKRFRHLRSTFCFAIFVVTLRLSECQEACKDQKWCSAFSSYCSKADLLGEMRRLCPIACGDCQPNEVKEVVLSPWSEWTECSSECGYGIQRRTRSCNSSECSEDVLGAEEERKCYNPCNLWRNWETWSDCSATCDGGIQTRVRSCMGRRCNGESKQLRACLNQGCGMWAEWSGWSPCSRTCGGGARIRSRLCMNGVPKVECEGPERQETDCTVLPACSLAQYCEDSQPWCSLYGERWCASWDFSTQCRKLCGRC